MSILLRLVCGTVGFIFSLAALLFVWFSAGIGNPNYSDPSFNDQLTALVLMVIAVFGWYFALRPSKKGIK